MLYGELLRAPLLFRQSLWKDPSALKTRKCPFHTSARLLGVSVGPGDSFLTYALNNGYRFLNVLCLWKERQNICYTHVVSLIWNYCLDLTDQFHVAYIMYRLKLLIIGLLGVPALERNLHRDLRYEYKIFYEITNRCSYMQSILFHC